MKTLVHLGVSLSRYVQYQAAVTGTATNECGHY